jgi:protein-S-isoprenylcysteine O-methyltransferase Ste14
MTDRPPLWAILGTLIAAPLFVGGFAVYVPYLFTGWQLGPPLLDWEWTRWVGFALMVLAAPVILDFLLRFILEGHGTPVPVAPPQRLVVRGVFRFTRNPAYLAAVTFILGQGLVFASSRVLIYAGILAVAFHLFVIGYEEPTLRGKFGAAYEEYCRTVPRWIPRVRRSR